MPQLAVKETCTGCAACYNKCKFNAIEMVADNTGFLFPVINQVKCIECNACENACPVLVKDTCNSDNPRAYIAQNKDEAIRMQSTSGGAFSSIATQIINQGGVVFGAAFVEDYSVAHVYIDEVEGLEKFRNSKYVQSEIRDTYSKAEEFLKEGKIVCFSGTPCQIYGLKRFLGKDYDNLYTVDVMCRAVPSPKVFKKYLEYQKEKYPSMNRIVFRDKVRGYSYSSLAIYSGNKNLYKGGSEYDQWLRIFFSGYCNRKSCESCQFQSGARNSDFTLWDCWGTQNYAPEMDDNKGTTNIIVWTERGQKLFDEIKSLNSKEIGIENIDASLSRGKLSHVDFNEKEFWNDVDNMQAKEFLDKYVPFSSKVRVKSVIRQMIWRLHLHNAIRKAIHKLRKIKKKFGKKK